MTPQQLSALEAAAAAALGRPESRCQVAMSAVYQAAGLLPASIEVPDGPRDAARWANRSLFRDWLTGAGAAYFHEVQPAEAEAGDLLCFRLGHVEHHVAILLTGGRLVHVFGPHGVQIAPCIPTPWAKRLSSVWRLHGTAPEPPTP